MDNARPHNAQITTEKMHSLNMLGLPQPAYSPDISPNDFFLYGYVKERLKGLFPKYERCFKNNVYFGNKPQKKCFLYHISSWITELYKNYYMLFIIEWFISNSH